MMGKWQIVVRGHDRGYCSFTTKNFEPNIAWGDEKLHVIFWFEQLFDGKLFCKIHDLLSVTIIFFWIGLLGSMSD